MFVTITLFSFLFFRVLTFFSVLVLIALFAFLVAWLLRAFIGSILDLV